MNDFAIDNTQNVSYNNNAEAPETVLLPKVYAKKIIAQIGSLGGYLFLLFISHTKPSNATTKVQNRRNTSHVKYTNITSLLRGRQLKKILPSSKMRGSKTAGTLRCFYVFIISPTAHFVNLTEAFRLRRKPADHLPSYPKTYALREMFLSENS